MNVDTLTSFIAIMLVGMVPRAMPIISGDRRTSRPERWNSEPWRGGAHADWDDRGILDGFLHRERHTRLFPSRIVWFTSFNVARLRRAFLSKPTK